MKLRVTPAAVLAAAVLAAATGLAAAGTDEKADALVTGARRAALAAKTLSATVTLTIERADGRTELQGACRLMKPNFGRIRLQAGDGGGQVYASDGSFTYQVLDSERRYRKSASGPAGGLLALIGPPDASPTYLFLNPDRIAAEGSRRYAGRETVAGRDYETVLLTAEAPPTSRKLYFGPGGLLEGVELTGIPGNRTRRLSLWLREVRTDTPISPAEFAFQPPAGYTQPEEPAYVRSLLPVGAQAPDFLLPAPGGGHVSLESTLKGKKAVLINFWFYN